MYSREEIKQLHVEFWTAFGQWCMHLPRFKYRNKPWILYNTKIKGVEMKFDASSDGVAVIFEINHRNPRKRAALWRTLNQFRPVFEEHFPNAVWEPRFVKPCGTEVCRVLRRNGDLNFHNRDVWADCFVFLSKNMSALEKAFEELRETLRQVVLAPDNISDPDELV